LHPALTPSNQLSAAFSHTVSRSYSCFPASFGHQPDSMTTQTFDAWEAPQIDFYHLPFDSDLPEDILEASFGCDNQHRATAAAAAAVADPYANPSPWTPPYTSEDEAQAFSSSPLDFEGLLTAGTFAADDIWSTPPASPPYDLAETSSPLAQLDLRMTQTSWSATEDNWSKHAVTTTTPPESPTVNKVRRKSVHAGVSKPAGMKKKRRSSVPANVARAVASAARTGLETPEMSDDEPESKRKSHNVLERKRRNDLKMSYQALRVEVPAVATNERAPTGHILIESWKYIEQLKKEEQELVAAIAVERLRKQQLSQLLY